MNVKFYTTLLRRPKLMAKIKNLTVWKSESAVGEK